MDDVNYWKEISFLTRLEAAHILTGSLPKENISEEKLLPIVKKALEMIVRAIDSGELCESYDGISCPCAKNA